MHRSLATQVKQLLNDTRVSQRADIPKRVLLPAQTCVLASTSKTAGIDCNMTLMKFLDCHCDPLLHLTHHLQYNGSPPSNNGQASGFRMKWQWGFIQVQIPQDNAYHIVLNPNMQVVNTRAGSMARRTGPTVRTRAQALSKKSYLFAIFRRMRRMILPERVFGMPGAQWMVSGVAIAPMDLRTAATSSFRMLSSGG